MKYLLALLLAAGLSAQGGTTNLRVKADSSIGIALRRYYTARPDSVACIYGTIDASVPLLTIDSVTVVQRCYPPALGALMAIPRRMMVDNDSLVVTAFCGILEKAPRFSLVGAVTGIADSSGHRIPEVLACWRAP